MRTCALCDNESSVGLVSEGDLTFCCIGCHTVFNILSTKNELENFREHPIFKRALSSGLISNPLLQTKQHQEAHAIERIQLEIGDMWCPSCAEIVRLVLMQENGVHRCIVDYATDLAAIEFAPQVISKNKIFELIHSLGYRPLPLDADNRPVSFDLKLRFAVAAFCSLNVMMFAYPLYATYFHDDPEHYGSLFAWLSLVASIPVVTYSAWPIIRRFLTSLRVGLYGMETLVVIGVMASFVLSLYELMMGGTRVYFDSMTVIITFVLLGKIVESKAKFSAKDALNRLARALPRRGRKRFADGSQAFVNAKELQIGDTVVVHAGEKVVLDGELIEGSGSCDESLMTGEAIPVEKRLGTIMLGGSIVQNGSLVFRVTSQSDGSALHKIVEMVQQELSHKSSYVRAADTIVRWFVPLVLIAASMTALGTYALTIMDPGYTLLETAFIRAISVLLISCPCAIGIAAPLAEAYVLNGLASLGAIVRNRGCLALLGKETVFVFDKTGTVTVGAFTVLSGLNDLNAEEIAVLKGLAEHSNHLISRAITQTITTHSNKLEELEEIVGKGIQGKFKQEHVYLGSASFLQEKGFLCTPQPCNTSFYTTVYFAIGQRCITLVLGDQLRTGIDSVIRDLSPAQTILLSGDASSTVEAVAQTCGFTEWHAEFTPSKKRTFIDTLRQQGHIVCMLGDGMNDAPALGRAHIGISVVSATDLSIQASDILLTTDRFQVLQKMRLLALKGHAIIKQNLFWAFFYNIVGIGLAAAGKLSPIFAAFAMVTSSLMVLFNAKRARN
ncbi:MAG: cation-translocating P-type ATPase [Parachlamydiaceae bacterium]|nr:cation-translocating P-type ATPase [Parachlamydiaceae bacterium]